MPVFPVKIKDDAKRARNERDEIDRMRRDPAFAIPVLRRQARRERYPMIQPRAPLQNNNLQDHLDDFDEIPAPPALQDGRMQFKKVSSRVQSRRVRNSCAKMTRKSPCKKSSNCYWVKSRKTPCRSRRTCKTARRKTDCKSRKGCRWTKNKKSPCRRVNKSKKM